LFGIVESIGGTEVIYVADNPIYLAEESGFKAFSVAISNSVTIRNYH